MNKQKFNNVVINPENITAEDKANLRNLAKNYPYSQIIHSLAAKAYAQEKTSEYKNLIGIAAMYATDRHVLKDLVTKSALTNQAIPVKDEVSTSPEVSADQNKAEVVKPKQNKVNIDTSSFYEDSEMLRNAIWADLENLKLSKEHYLDSLEHSLEVEKKTTTKKAKKSTSGTSTTTQKTSVNTKSLAKKESPKKAQPKAATKKTKAKSADIKTEDALVKITKTKAAPKKSTTSKAKAATTSKSKPKNTTLTASKAKALSKKSKTPSTDSQKKSTEKDTEISEQRSEIKATLKEQINIIDSFIKKEPSISSKPVKSIDSDQKDLSEKSTNFGDDLISENLAQILVEQGKTQKAVDMYKKLIWKFPQKKAYFAARIEDLNK